MTTEEVHALIEEKWNKSRELIENVFSIFKDFFGEDRVDLQGLPEEFEKPQVSYDIAHIVGYIQDLYENSFILVYYPTVTIENEYNRTHIIRDLFVKVKLNGQGGVSDFRFNRATYTEAEWVSDYLHSHVHSIPKRDLSYFQTSCLGTGPINNTLELLEEYDENRWRLFCLELDKYVQTESLAGGPYHRMEHIGLAGNSMNISISNKYQRILESVDRKLINNFLIYFFNLKKLKFNYVKGVYSIGIPPKQLALIITDEFIKWYNNLPDPPYDLNTLQSKDILIKVIIKANKLYIPKRLLNSQRDYSYVEGTTICYFKKIPIKLQIIKDTSEEVEHLILSPEIISYIVETAINIINIQYGKHSTSADLKKIYLL